MPQFPIDVFSSDGSNWLPFFNPSTLVLNTNNLSARTINQELSVGAFIGAEAVYIACDFNCLNPSNLVLNSFSAWLTFYKLSKKIVSIPIDLNMWSYQTFGVAAGLSFPYFDSGLGINPPAVPNVQVNDWVTFFYQFPPSIATAPVKSQRAARRFLSGFDSVLANFSFGINGSAGSSNYYTFGLAAYSV